MAIIFGDKGTSFLLPRGPRRGWGFGSVEELIIYSMVNGWDVATSFNIMKEQRRHRIRWTLIERERWVEESDRRRLR